MGLGCDGMKLPFGFLFCGTAFGLAAGALAAKAMHSSELATAGAIIGLIAGMLADSSPASQPHQKDPQFVQRFSSAYLEHFHYEAGENES